MKVIFTNHSLSRAKERGISENQLKTFISAPDKIEVLDKNTSRFLFKKVYFNDRIKKDHLLLIVTEKTE